MATKQLAEAGVTRIVMPSTRTKVDRELLFDAAQCLDDCLVRIYPEEFTGSVAEAAKARFLRGGGIISRTATIADALRVAAKKGGKK